MTLGFSGDVVDYYQHYRRGYPPEVISTIVEQFTLTANDIAIDLGCGTGQLTLPLAQHLRAVIGMDPEPDMLARARETSAANVNWMIGADTDIPGLTATLGERTIGAVTIGQALHWMDHDTLFHALIPLLRKGGGVAVVTNGTPLWLQDSPWSRGLRGFIEDWLGQKMTLTCGFDAASQQRYRDSLTAAGYDVQTHSHDYTDELTLEQIAGNVYSALPVHKLPAPDQRPHFAAQIEHALEPHAPFVEPVHVATLTGQIT